jgi:hypothetical protein
MLFKAVVKGFRKEKGTELKGNGTETGTGRRGKGKEKERESKGKGKGIGREGKGKVWPASGDTDLLMSSP